MSKLQARFNVDFEASLGYPAEPVQRSIAVQSRIVRPLQEIQRSGGFQIHSKSMAKATDRHSVAKRCSHHSPHSIKASSIASR